MSRSHSYASAFVITLMALLLLGTAASAEQLALRHYGVYEGLSHSNVRCVLQDSKGYLWVGTADGLSRFDGYRFTSYSSADGLGHNYINALAEDPQGRIWIATNGGGVSCFRDRVAPTAAFADRQAHTSQKFLSFSVSDQPGANRVNSLVFDSSGRLWCSTDSGLYRTELSSSNTGDIKFESIFSSEPTVVTLGAFSDRKRRLWFGIGRLIVECVANRIITYGPAPEFGNEIRCFAQDNGGRLLAATEKKLIEFVEPSSPEDRGRWRSALPNVSSPYCLLADSQGTLWIGTEHGLLKYNNGVVTNYTMTNGLSDNNIQSLAEDQDRSLWIGTYSGGLCMLAGEPAVAFGRMDGLPDSPFSKLFTDQAGRVFISTRGSGLLEVTDGKARSVSWSHGGGFNKIEQRICQDDKNDWWIGTDRGLFWFRGADLNSARGRQISVAGGGPGTGVVGDIYRDVNGRLWLGSIDNNLYSIDRSGKDGQPCVSRIPLNSSFPYRRIVEDRSGALWIGAQSLLSRLKDGRDVLVQPVDGLPEITTRALFLDSRGWLWLGLRNKGVSVTQDPESSTPTFRNFTTNEGLASNTVWSIAEDRSGRIYLGTGRGLDRVNPLTSNVQHIAAGANLMGEAILQCVADLSGNIWAMTTKALVRLDTRAELIESRAPPVFLTKLYIAGAELPMPDAGTTLGPLIKLGSSGNNLLIEFVGLDFRNDHELKYQYKLAGLDTDWGPVTDQRSVNYASFAPGTYTFMVRAINAEGIVSSQPAVVQIQVMPPFWRQWWFLLGAAISGIALAYAAHRYRVARLMEMLAVRTRIASDLHDDIGSNLTKIAILSAVAYRQQENPSFTAENPLSTIARISRESVASMSDIVWAIDPRRDTHLDLIRRMRQFAIEMLGATGADARLTLIGDETPRRVGPDFRRQVFLIFKEAVHNAARHSRCSSVEIEIAMDRRGLTLSVRDDGTGFSTDERSDGQGIASMQRRARSLNGLVEISSNEQGTTVTVVVPWTRREHRSGFKGETYLHK